MSKRTREETQDDKWPPHKRPRRTCSNDRDRLEMYVENVRSILESLPATSYSIMRETGNFTVEVALILSPTAGVFKEIQEKAKELETLYGRSRKEPGNMEVLHRNAKDLYQQLQALGLKYCEYCNMAFGFLSQKEHLIGLQKKMLADTQDSPREESGTSSEGFEAYESQESNDSSELEQESHNGNDGEAAIEEAGVKLD